MVKTLLVILPLAKTNTQLTESTNHMEKIKQFIFFKKHCQKLKSSILKYNSTLFCELE